MTNPTQKRLLWALLASLGVNVFLLGFVFARALGPRSPAGHGRHPHDRPALHPRALFGLEGPAVRGVLRERREGLEPERRALREARSRVRAALEAEPYSPAALEQALGELRERTGAVQAEMHRALLDVAATLSAEERRGLVQKNFRGPRRGPRGPRD